MMRLSNIEFKAMNNAARRLLQRTVEYPFFRRMGLTEQDCDILEIGCGSGYGAVLLSELRPESYVGVDLMPEQIALAHQRRLPNAEFMVQDAARLPFADESKDVVVIFGVLHHIPVWRKVVSEIYRVLRPGGRLFVEEPDGAVVAMFDRVFAWGHTPDALFLLTDFERFLQTTGFTLLERRYMMGFGWYHARK
jgi:ubiquinone/menaquinone biosynthesis C-methylase UbiE